VCAVAVHIHWRFAAKRSGDLFEYANAVTEALLDQEQCTHEVEDSAVSDDRSKRVMEIEATVRAPSMMRPLLPGTPRYDPRSTRLG
jgi:hypothetical protein